MEIVSLAGTVLTQLHEGFRSVGDLKKLFVGEVGSSRFRQRLFHEEIGELHDDMPDMPVRQLPICSW